MKKNYILSFLTLITISNISFGQVTFDAVQVNPFGLVGFSDKSNSGLGDLDNDGDLDIISAQLGVGGMGPADGLYFYENTGTSTAPSFGASQLNPFSLSGTDPKCSASLGDLDNDGDLDLLCGLESGGFLYYENTGTAASPSFAVAQSNPFNMSYVNFYTTAAFIDLDGDNDLDVMAGCYDGSFFYIENIGSASVPNYGSPVVNPFGLSNLSANTTLEFVDIDNDNDMDMFASDYGGYPHGIWYMIENTGTSSSPTFAAPTTNPFNLTTITGYFAYPLFGDLDADGDMDLLGSEYGTGSPTGAFYYFENLITTRFGTDTRTECNSYTWIDGNNYTSSNNSAIFNIVGGAANGCDSLVTLDLTIANSTSGTDFITACGSELFEIPNNGIDDNYDGQVDEYLGYQWIDNNYYTTSNNTATWIETNAAGCDSTVALDLTILPPFVTEEDVITACDSYTWIDGTTYTSSSYGLAYFSDVNGCDSVLGFLDLTINSVSDLTASTSGLVITANNIDATYQWLDCDNSNAIIPGETGQSYTAITNGNYAVELTENGCVDTTACVSITSVGVLENTFGDEFAVYPNPTNGNFSINLGAIYESLIVSITDISGKLIDSKTITQSQILNLNIKEPAGLYMVSVQAGDKKANIRLIKE